MQLKLRSFIKFGITFLAFIALASQYSEAQVRLGGGRTDTGPRTKSVRGVVQDLRGTPVTGARVSVRNAKTNVTRTALTNAQGLYSVAGLPPDADHEVTVDFKGQTSEKKVVSSFLNRDDNVLNFQLDVSVIDGAPASSTDTGPYLNTFDLVRLRASFEAPTGLPAPLPAVLLLHGFGEDRFVWDTFKKQLISRGWAVMTLDLRGHGESKTRNQLPITANEQWRTSSHEFPLDIDPALDWLKAQPRVDTNKIVVMGYDIGANLALIASGRFPEVRTVVAVHPNLMESLAMAGSAQDFTPRSALLVVPTQVEADAIKPYVQNPVQVRVGVVASGTASSFQDVQFTNAIFQWLRETF